MCLVYPIHNCSYKNSVKICYLHKLKDAREKTTSNMTMEEVLQSNWDALIKDI